MLWIVSVAWLGEVRSVLDGLDNCIVTVVSLVASGLLRIGIGTVKSVWPGWKMSVVLTFV